MRTARALKVLVAAGCLAMPLSVVLTAGPAGATAKPPTYYLSLGDSYSVGYQPNPADGTVGAASAGYTDVLLKKEHMTLENYGCGGATTSSILAFDQSQCGQPGTYGPAAIDNQGTFGAGESQVQDAVDFIDNHPLATASTTGKIGLITVSISGNDITPCAGASAGNPVNGATDPVACVVNGMASVTANIGTLVTDLVTALQAQGYDAGGATNVPLVGLTYPDVLLGLYVNSGPGGSCATTPVATKTVAVDLTPTSCPADKPAVGSSANETLANESVTVFSGILNPALQAAYTAAPGGMFVNITSSPKFAIAGNFNSIGTSALGITIAGQTKIALTPANGFGLPKSVLPICKMTWYCKFANIHANDKGYKTIALAIHSALHP